MMKSRARKSVALLLSVIMAFSFGISPAFAQEIVDNEISYTEELVPLAESIEPFAVSASPYLNLRGFGLGDVDSGGSITSADATLIARWLVTPEADRDTRFPNFNRRAADLDLSGEVGLDDLTLLARALVGHNVAARIGAQPGSLTVLTDSIWGMPIYDAEILLTVNGTTTSHQTSTGIISFGRDDVPAGSSVSISATPIYDDEHYFFMWQNDGTTEISPFSDTAEFIMPSDLVVLAALFETPLTEYFDLEVDPVWCDDVANAPIEYTLDWDITGMSFALTDTTTGQALEFEMPTVFITTGQALDFEMPTVSITTGGSFELSYGFEIELPEPHIELIDASTGEPVENFHERETVGAVEYPAHTLNFDISPFSVSPMFEPWRPSALATSVTVPVVPRGLSWTPSSSDTSWLTISHIVRVAPHNNDSLQINVTENTANAPRQGTIRVTYTDNAFFEIEIIQGFGPALYLLADGVEWQPPAGGEALLVDVFSNRQWTIRTDRYWLEVHSYYPPNRTGFGAFMVRALPNLGGQRSGEITVTAGGITRTIPVTQSSGPVLVSPVGEITLWAIAFSIPVAVTSNRTWDVSSNQPWLTVSPARQNGSGSFTMTLAANLGVDTRTARVTVSTLGVPDRILTVHQEAGSGLVLSADTAATGPMPSSQIIDVFSNRTWGVPTSDSPWLTVSDITPANRTGNGSFRITSAGHTGFVRREGIVTVTAPGSPARTIRVFQEPGHGLVLSNDSWETDAGAIVGWVYVSADRVWNVPTSNVPWMTIEQITPANRSGDGRFAIRVEPNLGAQRNGRITVTSAGAFTRHLYVTQLAGMVLELSGDFGAPTSARSITTAEVTSNRTWDIVSSHPAWLTTNRTRGSGSGTFEIIVAEHFGSLPRTGVIRVRTAGVPERVITIRQEGRTHNLTLSQNLWEPLATGGNRFITVTSTARWTVQSSASWLTVNTGNGGTGFLINATANPSPIPRPPGFITVTAPGAPTRMIRVVQQPRVPITVYPPTWTPSAVARINGTFYIGFTPGMTWNVSSDSDWLIISNTVPVVSPGRGRFTVTAERNTGLTGFLPRDAIITITAGDDTATIPVRQEVGAYDIATIIANAHLNGIGHSLMVAKETGNRAHKYAFAISRGERVSDVATQMREHNRNLMRNHSGFIHGQWLSPQSDLQIGFRNVGTGTRQGCGPISVYNALVALSRPQCMGDITHWLFTQGGFNLGGEYGTNPHTIFRYLRGLGVRPDIQYMPIQFNGPIMRSRANTAILLYAGSITYVHYVMIRHNAEQFEIYNWIGNRNEFSPESSIDAWATGQGRVPLALITFS